MPNLLDRQRQLLRDVRATHNQRQQAENSAQRQYNQIKQDAGNTLQRATDSRNNCTYPVFQYDKGS